MFLKGTKKSPNITFGIFSISLAVWCFGQFMGGISEGKEMVLFWTRVGMGGAVFLPLFFAHFIVSLVGQEKKHRLILGTIYAVAFVFFVLLFTPYFIPDVKPVPGFSYYPEAGIVYPFFALFVLICFIYGFFMLFSSYFNSDKERKVQISFVIFASVIGFLGGITAFFPVWGINLPVVSHLVLPIYLMIVTYAVLKLKLIDLVRESIVYSILTLIFTGFYILAVITANNLLANLGWLNIVLVIFISVLFFQPLRNRIQRWVDRLFFRGEFLYQQTISNLSAENVKLFRTLLRADKLAALGTLSAGMAHEIKNPLASIKGMTQVLDDNLDDPEFIKNYQGVLTRQIDRINNLVEKLLKFGQPQELIVKKIDINRIIGEILGLLESQFRKKGIKTTIESNNLPEIEGDFEQLSQVFMNLFLNAISAMKNGGELEVKSEKDESGVKIEVTDTGSGIDPSEIDKIFDPFFSLKEEGAGMGLAVAYRIIKEHKGEINVSSEPGKGTTFSIWLPIKPKQ
jgi:signal transduction histidine kinase